MNEMVAYIFRKLHASEVSMENILNFLTEQSKFNQTIANFALAATVHVLMLDVVVVRQQKQIKELNDKIKELNHPEGE